jgi:hypothetical protein
VITLSGIHILLTHNADEDDGSNHVEDHVAVHTRPTTKKMPSGKILFKSGSQNVFVFCA